MQVRLTTTISTVVDITSGACFEEAKKEIFGNYQNFTEDDDLAEDIKYQQSSAVIHDTVIASEVTHSFEEVKLKEVL